MKKAILLLAVLLTTHMISAQGHKLKFDEDHKFKIVQFTDLHIVAGRDESAASVACLNSVLDAEKPDLVILTGDIIFGAPAKEGLKMALQPIIERNIPFAVTLGNHDDESGMSRKDVSKFIEKQRGNIGVNVAMPDQEKMGYSNFTLEIYDGEKLNTVIYCFDSHSYDSSEKEGYAWILHDQISWYRQKSAEFTMINDGKPVQAISFFHIPLPEYKYALATEGSLICGNHGEDPCCPNINSGLFASFKEMGDVKGVFVGHDHNDDFVANYMGIYLCYGRFSGCNTVYNDLEGNGARVILLHSDSDTFDTWIRLTDGKRITQLAN